MIRMLTHFVVNLVSSALALLVAWWLIPGFDVAIGGFVVAVVVFTVAQSLLGPFAFNVARQHSPVLLGGIGLISTLLSLVVASLFPRGITLEGLSTWFIAAVVVWFVTAVGGWILLAVLARRTASKRREKQDRDVLDRLSKRVDTDKRSRRPGDNRSTTG